MSLDAYPWPSTLTKGALIRAGRVKQIVLALQCDDLNALQIEEMLSITQSTRRKDMQPLLDCGLVTVADRLGIEKGKGMAVFRISGDQVRVAHYLKSLGTPEKVKPTNVSRKKGEGPRSVDMPRNPGWVFQIPAPDPLLAAFYGRAAA